MSTYQAVAAVTQTLRYLIGLEIARVLPGGAEISARPPESQEAANRDQPRINVFLFQVRPNASLRNSDKPTFEGGQAVNRPRVAIDLNYLISFFGTASQTHLMLGATEVALRRYPYLGANEIRDAVRDHPELAGSRLDEQQPPVRLSPLTLALEDLTRFWSGFLQTPYTLSVVYEASPVLMEAETDVVAALEVQQPKTAELPQLAPQLDPVPPVDYAAGTPVAVSGRHLTARDLIGIEGDWVALTPTPGGGLQFALPADTPAGVHTLRVGAPRAPGARPTVVPSSNTQSLIVRPVVAAAAPGAGGTLDVEIAPPLGDGQQCALNLIALAAPEDGSPLASARVTPPTSVTGSTVSFRAPDLPAGRYLVSVEVDGATSTLQFVDGRYREPTVTLA